MYTPITVYIEGKPFTATPDKIVKFLSKKNFFVTYNNINEFIERVTQDIWRLYGIGITLTGSTTKEKCEQLVYKLIEHGLLREAE